MRIVSEAQIEEVMQEIELKDDLLEDLEKNSIPYQYVFGDEDLVLNADEEAFVFFMWQIIIGSYKKLGLSIEKVDAAELEQEESQIWMAVEKAEGSRTSFNDLVYDFASFGEDLFAFIEDGLSYDPQDEEAPITIKELSHLCMVKLVSLASVLHRTLEEESIPDA